MSSARKSIHFDAQGKGLYIPESAECGQNRGDVPKERLTTRPDEVTCQRCKRTAAFREAVEVGHE